MEQQQYQNACILWPKARNAAGYGITWHNNHWEYAHRAAVQASPAEVVRHKCDNPSCVNPEHLIKGTAKENMEDMVAKGRQAKGEQAGNSKLTSAEVLAIRAAQGCMSSREAAKIWGISKTNVLDIWRGYIWKHL